MLMKLTLRITGEQFDANIAVKHIKNTDHLEVIEHFSPQSLNFEDGSTVNYGYLSMQHADNPISKEGYDPEYEEHFVRFIEDNYSYLSAKGAINFELRMEIYYLEQCHFEFFDTENLARLGRCNVRVPVSVYKVEAESEPLESNSSDELDELTTETHPDQTLYY